ncbi:MAG: enoyl-CoA hydratase/isomerase family protein [Deltaproteobacteria bacterium]|nr:enoyl-CoA hydratase/isomerase family protein [Deltaproteobacteria bacterium]
MNTEYEYLLLSNKDGVTTITLNNPDKLNALNLDMEKELLRALRYVRDDNKSKVIIITGKGEKAFCAGADIRIFDEISSIKGYHLMRDPGYEVHRLMEIMEKPLIAAVNGYCLAGGLEIALACDLIIAGDGAVFGLPEINIGIIPGWGGCVRLARALGARGAKKWIMTGKQVGAKEAKESGLIYKLVEKNALMDEAMKLASELTSKAPNALKMAKMVINYSLECSDMDAALSIERGAISALMGSEDCAEGVAAFLEKRKPEFRGI